MHSKSNITIALVSDSLELKVLGVNTALFKYINKGGYPIFNFISYIFLVSTLVEQTKDEPI